jgi:hypothetical protein
MKIEASFTPEQLQKIIPIIEKEAGEFQGQLDDLYQACGLLLLGQLYGWRVMRLISSRSNWRMAMKLFSKYDENSELRALMPEFGPMHPKSVGLQLVGDMSHFWNVIKGVQSIPRDQRKLA